MVTTELHVKVDADINAQFADICNAIGMSTSTAINIFMNTVVRERRIPFELSADSTTDSFYNPANMAHLQASIAQMYTGQTHEHDLIED